MSECVQALSGVAWEHLVLALLHTLWQGAVLAGGAYLVLCAIPAAYPNLRYAICLGSLLAVVLLGLSTWHVLSLDFPAAASTTAEQGVSSSPGSVSATSPIATALVEQEHETLPGRTPRVPWAGLLVIVWLIGAAVMLIRLILSVAGVRRLRREAQAVQDRHVLTIVEELRKRLGIARKVGALMVEQIPSPAVLGIVWPALVLPASLVTGLQTAYLEAILAHELAHIRRYDYLVNLGQMVIESLLFFNPAIWWLSRQVRVEREACCDALAVSVTGGAIDYAECLADWAESHRVVVRPAAALAFAHDERYALLERIRRLLVPGYRPRLRLSWSSLAMFLIVSVVLAVGLWRGTLAAVFVVAQALSPQERIERIVEVEQKYAPFVANREGSQQKVTISGTIETEDGQPVPKQTSMESGTESPRGNASAMLGEVGPSFTVRVSPGAIGLMVTSDQYAPAVVGPFKGEPGGEIRDVKIMLRRGFVGRLKIVDEQGRPIPKAWVSGGIPLVGCYSTRQWITNDDGVIAFPHAGERPYNFEVRAPGFEIDRKSDVQLRPDEPVVWQLRHAVPMTATVLNSAGQPVVGATIRLFSERASAQGWSSGVSGPILTTTDGQEGRFRLDTLHRDHTYVLMVDAKEQGRHLVHDVKAGQQEREIRLGPKLTIRGKVIGDLSRLAQEQGRPVLSYSATVTAGNHSDSGGPRNVPVRVEGGEGHFVIDDLLPGTVELQAGPRKVTVQVREPVEGVVIDLAKRADPVTRRVVLRFESQDGGARVQGTVQVQAIPIQGQGLAQVDTLPIKDGRVETAAYVGGSFHYQPQQIRGYSFQPEHVSNVPPGKEPWEIRVPLIPAGAIAGRVLGIDGKPVADKVFLGLRATESSKRTEGRLGRLGTIPYNNGSMHVNPADGRFLIAPLPLGCTYVVKADRGLGANFCVSEPIELDEANPVQKLELRLAAGKTAHTQLVGPEGKPLAGISVSLRLSGVSGASEDWSGSNVSTDEQGWFRFPDLVPEAGEYSVRVNPRRDYQPAQAKLNPGGPPTIVRLKRGYVIEGRVVEVTTGRPVPDEEVYAWPERRDVGYSPSEAETPTDAEGRFRFSNLAKGGYELNVRRNQLADWNDREVVTAGDAKPVEIRVKVIEPR